MPFRHAEIALIISVVEARHLAENLKCPCHKMRVYIFEIYDTKYTEIRKQNRNCFFSVKVIAV
jgi:hypothetical protein